MPTSDGPNGLPIPVGSDANNIPADLGAMKDEIDKGSLAKRLAQAALNALPAAQKIIGMLYYNSTVGRFVRWDGNVFRTIAEKQDVDLAIPIAGIIAWPRPSPPPDWLMCDGSTFDPAEYPYLAQLLGGNTVPDLRDRFILGFHSPSGVVGSAGGSSTKTLSVGNLPAHAHGMGHQHDGWTNAAGEHHHGGYRSNWLSDTDDSGAGISLLRSTDGVSNVPAGNHQHYFLTNGSRANTDNAGSGTPFDVMPPFRRLAYIIRAK